MKTLYALLLLSLAGRASAQSFGVEAEELTHLRRLTPPPVSIEAGVAAQTLTKVCDDALWKRLLERAKKRPTRTQTLPLNGVNYTVHIVSTQTPVKGQDCPAGAHAENSLFVATSAAGTGPDLYPVRFSAVCRDESGVRDSFSLVADLKGNILGASLYNGSLGVTTHPLSEPVEPPNEVSALGSLLSRLVNLFLEAD